MLKLTQSYASFDLSELSAGVSMTTSPSAPTVATSGNPRKLPVPKVGAKAGHRSHSDLMMADVADAMEEMDALIRPSSGVNSPKLSSRKLPVPPVSAAAVISQSRRFLPRPLSCDVPAPGDAEPAAASAAGPPMPGFLSTGATSRTAMLLCRPYSFDYTCDPSAELDEAASMFFPRRTGAACGSDPTLAIDQTKPLRKSSGLTRQSSTTSCPALVRPCASPRSPKYQSNASPLNGASAAGSAASSLTNTPSPLPPALHAQDPSAFVPAGILVPLAPSPSSLTCSSPVSSSTSTSPRPTFYYGAGLASLSPNPTPVLIPSARSAFRAPQLAAHQRTTSLSLPTAEDGTSALAAAARRHRFHVQHAATGGVSVHDAGYRVAVLQRPSRSRQTARPR